MADPLTPAARRRRWRGLFSTVVLVGLFLFQVWEAKVSAERRIGVTLDTTAAGIAVTEITSGLPAEQAGLQVGDRLLAIGGMPVSDTREYDVAAARFEPGVAVSYRIQRGAEERVVEVRPGTPLDWAETGLTALALLAYLGIAWLASQQAEGDLRARLLELFTLAVAFEIAAPSTAGLIGLPDLEVVADLLFLLITGVQMSLELHLASVVPARQRWLARHPWVVGCYYAIGLGSGLTVAATVLAGRLGQAPFPWSAGAARAALFDVGMPAWAVAVAVLLGTQALGHPEPRGRQQAGLVLLGVLPWVATVVIGSAQALLGQEAWGWLGAWQLILLPYPIAIFIAIYRFQLFDIELVVRRSMLYTALTTSLLLVFYSALGAGGALFSHLVGGEPNSVWVIAAATLLLGLLFAPLRQWLQRLIDRRFFPERTAVRQRLVDLASELPALGKLPLMGRHLVGRLVGIFGIRSATLLLATPRGEHLMTLASTLIDFEEQLDQSFLLAPDDPGIQHLRRSARPIPAHLAAARSASLGQRLDRLEAELTVPLMAQRTLVGLLLLGEKSDGRPFTSEELELLNLLGHHVATVFENARLFESATFEGLTGLLRREAVLDLLDRELQRAVRYERPLALALADLDHFKEVNDRHGHLVGDLALKRVAQALSASLRATDAIGRFGGEEFLVVLPETELEGARAVAEKLRAVVEEMRIELEDGTVLRLTVSIGLTAAGPGRAWAPAALELLGEADRALYRAKTEGRNRVVA